MVKEFEIDDAFIGKWHPKYDDIEDDEKEYQKIVEEVSKEVSETQTISEKTFQRILDWKTPRAKGYVKWKDFGRYEESFKNVLHAEGDQKIVILDDLPGIGIPVASTVLHIISPETVPIVDFRTVEVLQSTGYLDKSKSYHYFRDTVKGYGFFRQAITKIAQRHSKWSLRQIDRALFAYHKIELEPETKKRERCH